MSAAPSSSGFFVLGHQEDRILPLLGPFDDFQTAESWLPRAKDVARANVGVTDIRLFSTNPLDAASTSPQLTNRDGQVVGWLNKFLTAREALEARGAVQSSWEDAWRVSAEHRAPESGLLADVVNEPSRQDLRATSVEYTRLTDDSTAIYWRAFNAYVPGMTLASGRATSISGLFDRTNVEDRVRQSVRETDPKIYEFVDQYRYLDNVGIEVGAPGIDIRFDAQKVTLTGAVKGLDGQARQWGFKKSRGVWSQPVATVWPGDAEQWARTIVEDLGLSVDVHGGPGLEMAPQKALVSAETLF